MALFAGVRPEKIRKVEQKFFKELIVGKTKKNEDETENVPDDKVEDEKITEFKIVSEQLSHTVITSIEHQLAEPQNILSRINITDTQVKLMDILRLDTPDLNRICKQVELIPWLAEDLGILVNGAEFRHRRPNESDVKVTDLRLILSYIGMETLKTLIPYFCARRWLPKEQSYISASRKKLWHYTSITASAAFALAKKDNKDGVFLYTCGLLYQLGISSILSIAREIFDSIRQHWLKEAKKYEVEHSDIYDAIVAAEFPTEFLYQYALEYAIKLNWQLVDLVHFEGSEVSSVLKELYSVGNYAELSEQTAIIARASCFAKVFLMERQRKITPHDRELLCHYYHLSDDVFTELKSLEFNPFDLM